LLQRGSSVWCWGNHSTNRICKFDHLCYSYNYDEFIFIHGLTKSIRDNLPDDRFNPTLLDMSSVEDHNRQYFNFVELPWQVISQKFNLNSSVIMNGNHLIFRRFYPSNIMHVIHDDLIPLYYTLRQYSNLYSDNIQVIFFDEEPPTHYAYLYNLFSNRLPLYKKDLISLLNTRNHNNKNNNNNNNNDNVHGSLICFQQVIVGISKMTTWYQYGFQSSAPQGPIQRKLPNTFPYRTFTQFIMKKLNIHCPISTASQLESDDNVIVIMLRHSNRLIINVDRLKQFIADKYKRNVITLSIEDSQDYNITHQLSILSCQTIGLIGMHGSALILGLFLPQNSFLLELFPYAINPHHYTPYKTMAGLPDIQLHYASWTNQISSHSIAHPEYPSQLGGINHLPHHQQEEIVGTVEVPLHSCCQDPNWLYHIYQDTVIEIESFSQQLTLLFDQQTQYWTTNEGQHRHLQFPPSRVDNITCSVGYHQGKSNITITWDLPWTIKLCNQQQRQSYKILFEIWLQQSNQESVIAYVTNETRLIISDNIDRNQLYYAWIRAIINDSTKGPFSNTLYCHT
ncbi:uncharacterized protein TRIADDRAFT_12816, partial [Trichoplax adhaerens]